MWLRRFGLWILRFDHGLKHWWQWLGSTGLDPLSPQLIVRSPSRAGSTGTTWPAVIPTPSHPPVDPRTITAWRSTWYVTIPPGLVLSGKHGAGGGAGATILCILELDCEP